MVPLGSTPRRPSSMLYRPPYGLVRRHLRQDLDGTAPSGAVLGRTARAPAAPWPFPSWLESRIVGYESWLARAGRRGDSVPRLHASAVGLVNRLTNQG